MRIGKLMPDIDESTFELLDLIMGGITPPIHVVHDGFFRNIIAKDFTATMMVDPHNKRFNLTVNDTDERYFVNLRAKDWCGAHGVHRENELCSVKYKVRYYMTREEAHNGWPPVIYVDICGWEP